jgi:ATP-dependent protease HslVU (ClpYQ) peptidase subunit
MSFPFSLQTTIMAVEYDGGVILGADSRTTTGKLIELVLNSTGHLFCKGLVL